MELRVLEYFLAVAREQIISAAAASLHLSQPTLSVQLRQLEQELGKPLLIRGSNGTRKITLTQEGMILRKRAEEIIALVHKTENEITFDDAHLSGDIAIGAGETQSIRLLARVGKTLNQHYPDLHYHIISGNAEFVYSQLDQGSIDFGLVFGHVNTTKYEYLPLPDKDQWGVLMRNDSPLAHLCGIQPQDLMDKPLILSHQDDVNGVISPWFKTSLTHLNIVATYNLVFNASIMTREGLGYTITLDHLINTDHSELVFVPLDPPLYSSASIIWKKYQILSKPVQKFLDCLSLEIKKQQTLR